VPGEDERALWDGGEQWKWLYRDVESLGRTDGVHLNVSLHTARPCTGWGSFLWNCEELVRDLTNK